MRDPTTWLEANPDDWRQRVLPLTLRVDAEMLPAMVCLERARVLLSLSVVPQVEYDRDVLDRLLLEVRVREKIELFETLLFFRRSGRWGEQIQLPSEIGLVQTEIIQARLTWAPSLRLADPTPFDVSVNLHGLERTVG